MIMAQNVRPHEPSSKRKRASLYVDEDFGFVEKPPGQESLSAFGLKLIDSRKSFAELYGITTTANAFSPQSANADVLHRKKRKKSSQITLADLNSIIDVDALMKKGGANSTGHGVKDGKACPRDKDNLHVRTEISKLPRSESDLPTRSDSNAIYPPKLAQFPMAEQSLKERQETGSHSTSATVPVTTKVAAEPRVIVTPTNHSVPSKNPRSSKKGFFNFQLPSRIPKRPRPEQFNAKKLPRPFALRQLNAVNSRASSNPTEVADATVKPVSVHVPKPHFLVDSLSNEDAFEGMRIFKSPSQPSIAGLRLDQQCGYLDRNTDCELPRNPDAAVQLLSSLPAQRRSAFLEHIFYFFNHNHLAMLIRLHRGQFIKCLEKWIVDGIETSDAVLLRASLLLLEVLPVTPSFHCKGLMKILKTTKTTDTVIKNLFSRVNEKWQFLEQTIRSHKAYKDKESEGKRSISFCDETETLEYSIHLPPDTVQKTKKCAVKGTLKQALKVTAVKDAPPQSSLVSPREAVDSIPKDPRLERSVQSSGGIESSASTGLESIMPSDLAAIRQSLDAESPSRVSSVPFGSQMEIAIAPKCGDSTEVCLAADFQASQNSEISQDVFKTFDGVIPSDCHVSPEVEAGYLDSQASTDPTNENPAGSQTRFEDGSIASSCGNQQTGHGDSVNENSVSLSGDSIGNRISQQTLSTPNVSVADRSQLLRDTPQLLPTTETDGDSMDALLSLVPSIVKDFSSSLLMSKIHPLTTILPNPFLSSSRNTIRQTRAGPAFPSDTVVMTR